MCWVYFHWSFFFAAFRISKDGEHNVDDGKCDVKRSSFFLFSSSEVYENEQHFYWNYISEGQRVRSVVYRLIVKRIFTETLIRGFLCIQLLRADRVLYRYVDSGLY